jgi:iron complex outermembrane receptor protein
VERRRCRRTGTASSTAFGGVSHRTGDSAGFFRTAGDGRNVPSVYPNGFLPNIRTTVKDASLALGYRRDLAASGNSTPASTTAAASSISTKRNTINVSYWYEPKPGGGIYNESPFEADTGA